MWVESSSVTEPSGCFQLSLKLKEMPKVGVRAEAGLNSEGWAWVRVGGWGGRTTLPGQPGKGRGEWPPQAAGLGVRVQG